jgi:hypothetical protein
MVGCNKPTVAKDADNQRGFASASYTVFGHDKNREFYVTRYSVFSNGQMPLDDLVVGMKYCPPSIPYICARSDFFSFAVPRRRLFVSDQWDFAGSHYQVVPISDVMIPGGRVSGTERAEWSFKLFGAEHETYVIEITNPINPQHCRRIVMYSFEHGLLGDSDACDDYSATSLLEGDDGYGSNSFNRLIYPQAFMNEPEAMKLFDKNYVPEQHLP